MNDNDEEEDDDEEKEKEKVHNTLEWRAVIKTRDA